MENVLDFSDKQARQIMLPRTSVTYLSIESPPEELVRLAAHSGHTRLPLCAGDLDHVLGVVHVKDVLRALADGTDGPNGVYRYSATPAFFLSTRSSTSPPRKAA